MTTRADEQRAARIVLKAIEEALARMKTVVDRRLLEGAPVDGKWVESVSNSLLRLADEYSLRILKGEWGKMLVKAAEKGVREAAASAGIDFFGVSRPFLEIALYNSQVMIRDILEEGKKTVNQIVTNAMVTGKSLGEISREVGRKLTLDDDRGVPRWRADMIARNETFSIYRQSKRRFAEDEGLEYFKMVGPVDSRTTDICLRHVGKTLSASEWEAIADQVFVYGLHYQCRHDWIPVRRPKERDELAERRADALLEEKRQQKAARGREAA